jgi:hypothetical protein
MMPAIISSQSMDVGNKDYEQRWWVETDHQPVLLQLDILSTFAGCRRYLGKKLSLNCH